MKKPQRSVMKLTAEKKKAIVNFLVIFSFTSLSFFLSCKGPSGDVGLDHVPDSTEVVTAGDSLKFLITRHQAGPFKIGDELPGPAHLTKYKVRQEKMSFHSEEGPFEENVTVISEDTTDLLWLKSMIDSTKSKVIREIIVVSPLYRTMKNVGIGSSIADFQAAYPDAHIWYTYVSNMFVIETNEEDAQFLLKEEDYTGPKPDFSSEKLDISNAFFHRDSKIYSIRLF